MQAKERRPAFPQSWLSRAAASLTWGTCPGEVATGSTTERSTPARAMEAARPAAVPSVRGRRRLMPLSLSRAAPAILSGKVWV